jgi:hypothetical protein
VITPYLFSSHFIPMIMTREAGWAALALSITIGLRGVALLTIPPLARVVLAIVYAPVIYFLLMNYGFTFNEVLFGG